MTKIERKTFKIFVRNKDLRNAAQKFESKQIEQLLSQKEFELIRCNAIRLVLTLANSKHLRSR